MRGDDCTTISRKNMQYALYWYIITITGADFCAAPSSFSPFPSSLLPSLFFTPSLSLLFFIPTLLYPAGLWPANWPCPALGLQPTDDHYEGKPSATGQPARPTQPFILPGSIKSSRLVYWMCAQVAPSGECLRDKGPPNRMLEKPWHRLFLWAKLGCCCCPAWQSVSCYCCPV